MLLTVFCLRRDRSELTFSLQVDADFELQNFRALCELESGIPAAESQIVYAEVPLTDNHRSLASYGLKDGDVVILQQVENAERHPAAPFPEKFTRVLVEQQQDRVRREQERIRLFSADPFDLEAQAKIEEDIRQQNIEENMTIAMEEAPESFGQVVMLYINCKVNGHPVKAFVDSGAQMTIMSQACAERCNIMRLVDRRWAGIAKGVGTQKIIGRVHLAQVQIEGDFLPCSFSILEEQPMDMLLGLDMLKRHQCSIDLKKNVLVIGTTGSQTTFLPEGELPECARLAYGAGREDVRPEEIADHELAEAIQKSVEEAENTDKETTSPELSLLPSSDGFQHPVRFPEVAVKTSQSFSRSLSRSVSAPSLVSHKCSRAQTVNLRAAKSVESLLEGPAALGREELLNLSDHDAFTRVDASLAGTEPCCSPNSPSPNTLAKPVASGNPEPSCAKGNGPGLESPLEETEGSGLVRAYTQAGDVAGLLPSLHLELSQMGPRPGEELGMEQSPDKQLTTARNPENVSATGTSPLPANGGQALHYFLSEGSTAKEGELKLSCEAAQKPEFSPHELSGNEMAMEVEVMDQVLIAADSKLKEQPGSLSVINSECSMMEAESSKSDSSLSVDLFSTSDLKQSERVTFESTDQSAAVGFLASPPPEGQLSHQAEEGACPSLTSALKELHQLLVASYRKTSGNESIDQPGTLPEEETADEGMLASVGTDASAGVWLSEPGAEDGQKTLKLPEPDALRIQEPFDWNSSTVQRPSAASRPLPCGESSEMLPPCLPSDHTEEKKQSSSSLTQGSESGRALNFPPGEPGMPVSSGADVSPALPICSPETDSAPPQPPVFPSVDIDQIVRVGFTSQEASEALEQAGGNVDLALLILLAKNIVVPT